MLRSSHAALLVALAFGGTVGAARPARAADPISIGVTTSLSGNAAYLGETSRMGADLAVKEANAAGGILGRPVAVDYQDNRCNPTEAVKGVSQMLSSKKYSLIFDGMCSSVVLAVMPLAERANVPFLSVSALSPAISEKAGVGGQQWTFVTNPGEANLAEAMVGWLAKENKARGIAFVGDDSDFARGGAAAYQAALQRRGLAFASEDFYQPGTADFAALFTKLRAQKPSSILLYAYGADYQNVIRQWYSFARNIPLTARLVLDQTPKEIIANGALEGVAIAQAWDAAIDTEGNKRFIEAYRKEYGKEPVITSYLSYDAMRLALDAIKRAGSSDPAAVREALRTTRFPSLIGGVFEFDDHNAAHNLATIQIMKAGSLTLAGLFKS